MWFLLKNWFLQEVIVPIYTIPLAKIHCISAMVHLVESVTFTKPNSKEESCQYDLESNKHKKHNCNHAEAKSSVPEDS